MSTAGPNTQHRRAVILGASNVTRGIATVAATAEALLGAPLQLMVAAGRGRSFGTWSRVLARTLPSILDSGIWRAAATEPRPTHALLTDVGNDILYGRDPEQILAWVEACTVRLSDLGVRVVLARLPLARLERVNERGYAAFRSLVVPNHRPPPLAEALRRARAVHEGLASVGERHGAVVVDPSLDWYGLDPVHVRLTRQAVAWRTMLGPWSTATLQEIPPVRGGLLAAGRLAATFPQCGTMFGVRFGSEGAQPGRARVGGTVVELY